MGCPKNQSLCFLEEEGDAYYRRNRHVELAEEDWPLRMIPEPPRRVLDIGCSRAWRLNAIRKRFGADCVGIDPSALAIAENAREYPEMKFIRCFVHEIPEKEPFDLVIVNFVLSWIARDVLFPSIAEIDRLAAKYVIIGGFHPAKPLKRKYHYVEDGSVYSYKQDYSQLFLSSGTYKLIRKEVYDYDECDKGFCALLKKEEMYIPDTRPIVYGIGRRIHDRLRHPQPVRTPWGTGLLWASLAVLASIPGCGMLELIG